MLDEFINPVFLSRIQFAFVVSFHIIFPAFTIGLASWLVVLEAFWLKTKHPIYKELYLHWMKIFAIAFGMGVVSGIVMSYQFGTNWAVFSQKTGNVLGPIMAFEVLTAFFLEASFLGIMLFGWNKVGPRLHFIATVLVAIGTIISAFWILSVNSWMQTPAGYRVDADGVFYPLNWLDILFNPSFPYRLIHMILAAYLSTAFLVAGVASWYLLHKKHLAHSKIMLAMATFMIILLPPVQLIAGHAHGINTLEYQPAKIAAMEGIWETEEGAALNLFGIPNETTETTDYSLQIPGAASLVLTGSLDGKVRGLKTWPKSQRPPVIPVFFSFRVMVGIGVIMILMGLFSVYLVLRKKLFISKIFHRFCLLLSPSGFIAILAGWITTEVGRQPYVVYGALRTSQAISPISTYEVSLSLLSFLVVYSIIFTAGIVYTISLIRKGPLKGDWHDAYGTHGLSEIPSIYQFFKQALKV